MHYKLFKTNSFRKLQKVDVVFKQVRLYRDSLLIPGKFNSNNQCPINRPLDSLIVFVILDTLKLLFRDKLTV